MRSPSITETRVLIVDDHPFMRRGLAQTINDQPGLEVCGEAGSKAEALALMAEAAKRGAQLLVFPEAFIGGYPKGADFHIYLGARTPQGRAEFKQYFDAAVELDGPEIAQLAKACAQHGMHAVVGIIDHVDVYGDF